MGLCRTNVMLDRELWKSAQDAGKADDRSGSWILNRALEQYLNKKKPSKSGVVKKYTDDDFKMAEWMWGRVQKLNPTAKEPSLEKWANTIRLMREVDGRTLQDIGTAFDWANKDSFWCSNILSPEKLRKQYDKLKVKANEANRPNQSKHSDGLSDSKRAMLQARAERDGLIASFGSAVGSDGGDVFEQVGVEEWRDSKLIVDGSSTDSNQ